MFNYYLYFKDVQRGFYPSLIHPLLGPQQSQTHLSFFTESVSIAYKTHTFYHKLTYFQLERKNFHDPWAPVSASNFYRQTSMLFNIYFFDMLTYSWFTTIYSLVLAFHLVSSLKIYSCALPSLLCASNLN